MIAKRLGAVVVAVLMIVGAVAVRSAITSDETPDDPTRPNASTSDTTAGPLQGSLAPTSPPRQATDQVVCAPDLADACRAAAAAIGTGIVVSIERVDDTLGNPADAPMVWVTLDPLPAALTSVDPSLAYTSTVVASSPLSLVVAAERSETLTTTCGAVVEWRCLGDHAGDPWADLGGSASWASLRPGFSPDSTAVGAVSVAAAVRSYFGTTSITATDPSFIAWARQFAGAVSTSSLSAGTAVGTIQVRPSTLDVAVGVPAELVRADDPRFTVLAVGDQTPLAVVVAERDGARAPDGFADAVGDQLVEAGWDSDRPPSGGLSGGDLIAAVTAWNDVIR